MQGGEDKEIIEALLITLRDPLSSLSAKYRVLFALRNIKDTEAHYVMAEGALIAREYSP